MRRGPKPGTGRNSPFLQTLHRRPLTPEQTQQRREWLIASHEAEARLVWSMRDKRR